MIESPSPNFKVGRTFGGTIFVNLSVVSLREPGALRTVFMASRMVDLVPFLECQKKLRDAAWAYLRAKRLTDFTREIVFEEEHLPGLRVGPEPSEISVQSLHYGNAGEVAAKVMALVR